MRLIKHFFKKKREKLKKHHVLAVYLHSIIPRLLLLFISSLHERLLSDAGFAQYHSYEHSQPPVATRWWANQPAQARPSDPHRAAGGTSGGATRARRWRGTGSCVGIACGARGPRAPRPGRTLAWEAGRRAPGAVCR